MPILGTIASSITKSKLVTSAVGLASYESIATQTVGSGGASSVTFSSIPSTFTHLQVRTINQTNRATYNTDDFRLNFNSDTGSNYAWHQLNSPPSSSSTTPASAATASTTAINGFSTASNVATNIFGVAIIDILDYLNTNKYTTVRGLSGADTNGAASGYAGFISLSSGVWLNTAAVSSITFYPNYGTLFNQYSSFALYGIKGA